VHKMLVTRPEAKVRVSLEKPRRGWEDNIEMEYLPNRVSRYGMNTTSEEFVWY
jgi:hypothetical protein